MSHLFEDRVKALPAKRIAVAAANDPDVLRAVSEGAARDLGTFILFGDEAMMAEQIQSFPELQNSPLVILRHSDTAAQAAADAVQCVREGDADVLMKGFLPTATMLKAVLNKEYGIRGKGILSQVAVFDIPGYDRRIYVTDAAMNISPDLETKLSILSNAVEMVRSTGLKRPKAALLSAVETVNPKMPSTVDAALIAKMGERGQIADCEVDGPLALDNAISVEAAKHKGLKSPVAGLADILVVPNIETGNALYKSLVYFSGAKVGSIVAGAAVPIVLTSRSDSPENKLNSILFALAASEQN